MSVSGFKVAILHDDFEVAERVASVASKAGLGVIRAQSYTWLQSEISDPKLTAVIMDLVGPRSGGFEQLERLCAIPSQARMIVITSLDAKTVDSTQRLADAKGFRLTVLRKDALEEQTLLSLISPPVSQEPVFGPEDLNECLEKRYFRVEYQPKVPLTNPAGVVEYGVEALCRILHPRFGNVPPDHFIPIAEKHGLVHKLTDGVVCESFRDHRTWRQEGLPVRLAVNISPELLKDAEWCDLFLRRCAEYEVEAEQVTLEITESSSGAAHPTAIDILTRLRLKGFTLSIDDFGTGFSSLSTLYKLPFGELKIDKSFILDLQKSSEARALIESTVSMAQRIGVKVVAEGVESEAIFRELRLIGCHEAQGYFVGKAMAAEKIARFFSDWGAMTRSQSIHAGTPSALPKIAMIQVLLNDILNDRNLDADSTLVLADFDKAKAIEGVDKDSTLELARKIPPLVLQGKTAEALANCHAAAIRLDATDSRESLKSKIAQLQSLLEQELVTTADIELVGSHGNARLLPRNSATLGRPSSATVVDIPVKCRWFSRGEKNLRIFSKGGEWLLEDRGSTNGNFIGNQRLEPRRPYALPLGETMVATGMQAGAVAPISIRLRRPEGNPNAVVITFVYEAQAARDGVEDDQWPDLQKDLETTWILFEGQISAGKSEACALVLEDCETAVAAHIRFKSGYWVLPAEGTELTLGDAIFCREVPIPPRAELSLAGALLTVREVTKDDSLPSQISAAIAARA
jgi:EAL domain-containing protein (putative c-di-GMP-specific phosphodiesterase class I)